MGTGGQVKQSNEKNEIFPNGLQAFLLVVALFLTEYVLGLALFDARGVLALSPSQLMVMVMLLGNGILLSSILHFKQLGYRNLLHPSSASPVATAVLLVPPVLMLVPAMLLCISAAIEWLLRWVPMSHAEEWMFMQFSGQDMGIVLAICVVAPVVEEMLFRGVVLRSFLAQYDRRQAIVGSALLFAVAHLNAYQFLAAGVLGLLLGLLYDRSRSLIPCVALHAVYNTGAVLLSSSADEGAKTSVFSLPMTVWLLSGLAALLGSVCLWRLLGRSQPSA
jgi:membrane protease YdiL (CAAX protease family)